MPQFTRTDGPTLHYVVDDYTDPWKDAPYLLLQHGNGRSGRFWYSWVPYLSRFYKVVRPDARGLGLSSGEFDLERELTLEACVKDLVDIIDDLGAQSVHVCGESMGGMLGIAMAAQHPQRVRTLTLVATPAFLTQEMHDAYALGRGSRFEAMDAVGRAAWLEATNRNTRFAPDADPQLVDWYTREYTKNRSEVQDAMSKLMNRTDFSQHLPAITAPVLALYPSDGPRTGPEQQEMLKARVKNLTIALVRSEFHKIQLMYPKTCATHVLRFISEHDGRSCSEE